MAVWLHFGFAFLACSCACHGRARLSCRTAQASCRAPLRVYHMRMPRRYCSLQMRLQPSMTSAIFASSRQTALEPQQPTFHTIPSIPFTHFARFPRFLKPPSIHPHGHREDCCFQRTCPVAFHKNSCHRMMPTQRTHSPRWALKRTRKIFHSSRPITCCLPSLG